ncbi:MAG: DUF1349 domain-containing protein [Actinomycetota bacterium]
MADVPGVDLNFVDVDDAGWAVQDGEIVCRALPHSDYFVDPSGGSGTAAESQGNAARYLATPPDGDWQLSARVKVDFASTFDAGVLFVWADQQHWAKLCFELSPAGEPMVVSVVTRGVSDDANSHLVADDHVHLRVSRIGRVLAFHSSADGVAWSFVRAFALGKDEIQIGFEVQSPMGDGCDVRFGDVRFSTTTLADLRDGS